ncbi:MAG: hypothetical protein R2754_01760 [Microthrixaceae bacterium]
MLSYFPARDLDEPASKDYIESRIAAIQQQMSDMEVRLTRSTHDEINGLRAETVLGIEGLRTDTAARIAALDDKIDALDTRLHRQTQLMVGMFIAAPSVAVAIQALLS